MAPVGGSGGQELVVVTRTPAGFERRRVIPVRFVPMTGEIRGDDPGRSRAGAAPRPMEPAPPPEEGAP